MQHVVAVADVGHGDVTQVGAFALDDGEDVREALAGVREIRESVDDRHARVARKFLDRLVRVRAQDNGIDHPRDDAGDIGDALAPAEADLLWR